MVRLNFDCIEHIMTFIPLRDKIQFAIAHPLAHEAFRLWAKRRCKIVESGMNDLSLKDMKSQIRLVGDLVEYLHLRVDLLPEISKYCTNLRHITVQYNGQFPLIGKLKSLVSVSNDTVCMDNCFVKDFVKVLKELPKLRSLCLYCKYYAGKHLCELTQIENLALYECTKIKFIHFKASFMKLKSLQNLYLHGQFEGNYKMPANMYKAMARHCKKLENLWLSHIAGPYELVADLPKLKRLSITIEDIAVRPTLFTNLAAKKAKQLECLKMNGATLTDSSSEAIGRIESLQELSCSLDSLNSLRNFYNLKKLQYLHFDCEKLTDEEALNLIRMLPCLHYFSTSSKNLSEKFVLDLIKMLRCKEESSARTNSKIIIGADGPIKNVLNNPLYLNAKDVIELVDVFFYYNDCSTMNEEYYDVMYFLHHV